MFCFLLLLMSYVFCLLLLYAIYYMFFSLFLLRFVFVFSCFFFSMMCFCLAYDFLTALVCWEFLGFLSFFLLLFFWLRFFSVKFSFKCYFCVKIGDFFFVVCFCLILLIFPCGFFIFMLLVFLVDFFCVIFFLFFVLGVSFSKSTQWFFYIWLPDAMEGPIPVSALIHAATLVLCGFIFYLWFFFCLSWCLFFFLCFVVCLCLLC